MQPRARSSLEATQRQSAATLDTVGAPHGQDPVDRSTSPSTLSSVDMSADSPETQGTLLSRVTPSGHVAPYTVQPDRGPALPEPTQKRILKAFAAGRGHGVLYLGAAELDTTLHPTLAYWRDLGKTFVTRACSTLDPDDPQTAIIPEPEDDELEAIAEAVPPMPGAEFVNPALLHGLWSDMGAALASEAMRRKDGVQGFLKQRSPVWHVVGRVCLHLAENKRNPEHPFAFMATYVRKVSSHGKPQHIPLGRALQEYAGANNRRKLLALLSPLSRAVEHSPLLAQLVDSGNIYHPQSWSPNQAHQFLCDTAHFEQAGLVVRVPDWWSAKTRRRPQVQVSVGEAKPAVLGMDALLDFEVELTLDGMRLTRKEIAKLLASTEGLALIKGRWVEADADQLGEVLALWQDLADQARVDGVSFGEAMRLLAGAPLAEDAAQSDETARPEWSKVVAGKWLATKLKSLRSPEQSAKIKAGAGLRAELRPYQRDGVQWLCTLRDLQLGGCLADDMGLGKTIQVLGLLCLTKRRKNAQRDHRTDLLVVPASLVDNWRLEIERFAPQLKVLIAHPSAIPTRGLNKLTDQEVNDHDAVITTYGTVMRTAWMKTQRWRNVILDEAQAIKNPTAKQTKAIRALDSQWRLALTGTPVENRLGDLWSIFDFLNPGLLGTAREFRHLCKAMASGHADGYAPLRRLLKPYILRRLKTDKRVISDLPDKSEVTAYCSLSKRQAALYQASVKELEKALKELDGIQRRGVVLAFLVRFKQICNHPSHWFGDQGFGATDSGKFIRLRELCDSIASRQDKVLVFTQFREMVAPLATLLAEIFGQAGLVLHGGTPVKKRQKLVQSFQQDDHIPFMVLSLKAGGTGLNLTAASHVVHFDRWWNPAVEDQATDRAYRIGQQKNVLVHKFVCRGTIEERIDEMIAGKRQLSTELLSGAAESSLTELSNDELLSMVSLDIRTVSK